MEMSPQTHMHSKSRYNTKRHYEGIPLLLFILAQITLLPLKPYFFPKDGEESLLLFISYQALLAFVTLTVHFLLKKNSDYNIQNDLHNSNKLSLSKINKSGQQDTVKDFSQEKSFSSLKNQHDQTNTSTPCIECRAIFSSEIESIKSSFHKESEEKSIYFINREKELLHIIETLQEDVKHVSTTRERLENEQTHLQTKLSSLFSLSRQLSRDLKAQYTLLDQERRKHAIEIRTILKRESPLHSQKNSNSTGDRPVGPQDSKSTSPFNVPQGTSVEAALICFLTTCKEALRTGENDIWPSSEHTYLIRRKFYDSLLFLRTVKVGATSIHSALPEIVTVPTLENAKKDLVQFIESKKNALIDLYEDEPLFATIRENEFVFFRCHEKNLEDIVIFGQRS